MHLSLCIFLRKISILYHLSSSNSISASAAKLSFSAFASLFYAFWCEVSDIVFETHEHVHLHFFEDFSIAVFIEFRKNSRYYNLRFLWSPICNRKCLSLFHRSIPLRKYRTLFVVSLDFFRSFRRLFPILTFPQILFFTPSQFMRSRWQRNRSRYGQFLFRLRTAYQKFLQVA